MHAYLQKKKLSEISDWYTAWYRGTLESSKVKRSTKAGEFKTKLKINHWRSSPGPPELAGLYVDSV